MIALEMKDDSNLKVKKKKAQDGKYIRRTLKAQDRGRQEKHDRGVLQMHMARILDQDISLKVMEPPERGQGKVRSNRRKIKTVLPPNWKL